MTRPTPEPLERREPVIEVVSWPVAEILRQETEAERLAIAWGLWKFARDLLRNVVRADHPDWSGAQVQHEVARRLSRPFSACPKRLPATATSAP
jgi:hypothetical protein